MRRVQLMPRRPVLMEEMTWPEVRAAASDGLPVLVPVGSTEQHGPHLPLNTDCVIPQAIALGVAEDYPVVCAPPVRFGAKSRPLSGGGETFPGTLSLRATTLLATLEDVVSGLARAGFRDICMLNWHYENAPYLWEACDLASREHPDVHFLILEHSVPSLTEAELEELFGGDFRGWDVEHAALAETSLMLAIRPDLVRRDLMADDEAERNPGWEVIPAPSDTIPRSGVLWHASGSTETAGHELLSRAVRHVRGAIESEFGRP
jgi:creatinine amidohydrolase